MKRSPLRWAGSKRGLLPEIRDVIPKITGRYVEPFMGSACVYFDLLPANALLSDLNSELVHFFCELRDNVHSVADAFELMDSNGDDYYEVRAKSKLDLESADRAARFLYLNRFGFNGVYRTNRRGEFNVPRGSRTGAPPSREELLGTSKALQGANIVHSDYLEVTRLAHPDDFVYLDPPYRNASRETYGEYGYGSFGTDEDVASLAMELKRLDEIGAKVLLSFNDDSELENALDGWEVKHIVRRRSVAASTSARTALSGEILAWNYQVARDD